MTITSTTLLTMPSSSYDVAHVRHLSSSSSSSSSSRATFVDYADCGGCNAGTCIEPEITEGSSESAALGPSCDCRDTGYIGEHCDVKCSKKCENGGKCIPANESTEDDRMVGRGVGETTCSCTKAVVDGNPYAGLTCEYGATKSCMTLGSVSKHSFCVNGGECAYVVLDNEQHVPCVCGEGFEGPHCEYLTGKAPSLFLSAASLASGGKADLIVFMLFAAIATVIGGLLIAFIVRGRQRRMEERRQEREARRATQEFAMVPNDDDDNDII